MAARVAKELGLRRAVSRQYLTRLLRGEPQPTEEKILLLVITFRELTGYAIRASDLFGVEPALPEGLPRLCPDALFNGRTLPIPVSSLASRAWSVFVSEPTGTSGDPVETLYVEYGVLLRSLAMRKFGIPPDDAEALAHDTFIAYLQRHTTVRDVKAWLMGALSNACRHYWRDRKREAPLPETFEETPDPAAGNVADEWEWRITVGSMVARLGAKCRETLERYYWREESKETIAENLDTSPGYVRQLLVACRRRLKEMLHGTKRGGA